MVSLKIYLFATLLLVSQGHSQFAGLPRCGCGALRPTGPIIPAGQFVLPAVVKPVVNAPRCQPRPTPGAPVAPVSPVSPVTPVSPVAPCVDFDEEDSYEDLLVTLITTFLDSKNPGKKYGKKGKGYDIDENECEIIVPSLYCPVQPAGGGPGADAPCVPEYNIILRLTPDACCD